MIKAPILALTGILVSGVSLTAFADTNTCQGALCSAHTTIQSIHMVEAGEPLNAVTESRIDIKIPSISSPDTLNCFNNIIRFHPDSVMGMAFYSMATTAYVNNLGLQIGYKVVNENGYNICYGGGMNLDPLP